MSPVAKAGTAGLILAVSPVLPLSTPIATGAYVLAAALLVRLIVDTCDTSYARGRRDGERAGRMATVIQFPTRRKDPA